MKQNSQTTTTNHSLERVEEVVDRGCDITRSSLSTRMVPMSTKPSTVLVLVKGGTFIMGTDNKYTGIAARNVTISSFYMGEYPITQKEWVRIMGNNPSTFIGDNRPVEGVTWYDAVLFCNKFSMESDLTPCYLIDEDTPDPSNINECDRFKWKVTIDWEADGYRLPTEAEWEFAAKGGILSRGYKYPGSDNIDEVAWYNLMSQKQTHDVGLLKPNELGLYDMAGNVFEWCWDWCAEYPSYDETDPRGASKGAYRNMRGGSWSSDDEDCMVLHHDGAEPDEDRYGFIGFRIVKSAKI